MRPVLLLAIASGLLFAGCMDPLHDYKACVKIEQARCQLRANCDAGFDEATCFAYYEEFCRTRKMNGPGSDNLTDAMVQACIDAILQVPCEWLGPGFDETELLPECDFLHKNPEDGGSTDSGDPDGGDDDAGDDSGPESIPGQFE